MYTISRRRFVDNPSGGPPMGGLLILFKSVFVPKDFGLKLETYRLFL